MLYLKAETNEKGQGYAKWYLEVASLHILSESPYKNFNAVLGHQENTLNSYVWTHVFIFVQCMPMLPCMT